METERRQALTTAAMAPQSEEEVFLLMVSLCRRLTQEKLRREADGLRANLRVRAMASVVAVPGGDALQLTIMQHNLSILEVVGKLKAKVVDLDLAQGLDPHKGDFKEMVVVQDLNQLL